MISDSLARRSTVLAASSPGVSPAALVGQVSAGCHRVITRRFFCRAIRGHWPLGPVDEVTDMRRDLGANLVGDRVPAKGLALSQELAGFTPSVRFDSRPQKRPWQSIPRFTPCAMARVCREDQSGRNCAPLAVLCFREEHRTKPKLSGRQATRGLLLQEIDPIGRQDAPDVFSFGVEVAPYCCGRDYRGP
jgi:hypothetical protein